MQLLSELFHATEAPLRTSPAWRTYEEIEDTSHGIIAVAIERTPCFGECPVYTAYIHADGRVEYRGDMHVKRLGEHRGKANLHEYRCLCQFIAGTRFWDMVSRYDYGDAVVTDCYSYYVMVETAERRKIVSNYCDAGPPELWAIAGLIDKVLLSVEWERKQHRKQNEQKDES